MSPSGTARPQDAVVRDHLLSMVDPTAMAMSLLLVADHRDASPVVYDVPISTELADELLGQVAGTATAAAAAELLPAHPGHTPGAQQWVHTSLAQGSLAVVEPAVLVPSHRQYERDTEFGRRNLLVLRLTDLAGNDLARMYQGFSPEKALAPTKRILAFWNGERFASLDSRPLIIDRELRLFVFGNVVVMKSNSAYESLFGPLPDLREQATSTYTATLGKLEIVGGDELRAACESDINMMRKLLSIQRKMDQPGYPEAVDMPSVLEFLSRNPHIDVPVDTSGDTPALVFQPQAQRRWALLKLLDDDFLHSDLTDINYEVNSKSEVPPV